MLEKLTENVYYMKYDDSESRPSLGLVFGEKASIMVDAGNSKVHAEQFIKVAEDVGVKNIKYLGITHFHWDHICGMNYLDICSIGSEATRRKVERLNSIVRSGGECEAEERNTVECLKAVSRGTELTCLDIGYSDRLTVDLGGIRCVFEHIGGDHAEDSSLIYVESEKIMFLGDATYRGFAGQRRYHSLSNVERLAERILSYDCEHYVTAHKEVYGRIDMENMLCRMIELGKLAENLESLDTIEKEITGSLSEEDVFYVEAFLEYKSLRKGGERAG